MKTLKQMTNIKCLLAFVFLFNMHVVYAQGFSDLISDGIKAFDSGNYNEALTHYEKALKIDPNSSLVNYEIAYTYTALKDYKKAIEHCNKVIAKDDEHLKMALVIKGSCLDYLDQPKKSVSVYKKAIKKFPDDYLLRFNLGVTYQKMKAISEAEKQFFEALRCNYNHSSSHYLLGIAMYETDRRTKCLVALYNFLLLENDTKRSAMAKEVINGFQTSKITENEEGNKVINISLPASKSKRKKGKQKDEDMFEQMNAMISSLSDVLDSNKTVLEIRVEKNKRLFKSLSGELVNKKSKWTTFYYDFFTEINNQNYTEAFTYHVFRLDYLEEFEQWKKEHDVSYSEFLKWLKVHMLRENLNLK